MGRSLRRLGLVGLGLMAWMGMVPGTRAVPLGSSCTTPQHSRHRPRPPPWQRFVGPSFLIGHRSSYGRMRPRPRPFPKQYWLLREDVDSWFTVYQRKKIHRFLRALCWRGSDFRIHLGFGPRPSKYRFKAPIWYSKLKSVAQGCVPAE